MAAVVTKNPWGKKKHKHPNSAGYPIITVARKASTKWLICLFVYETTRSLRVLCCHRAALNEHSPASPPPPLRPAARSPVEELTQSEA